MHPITVIEIILATVIIVVMFMVSLFLLKKKRKFGLMVSISISILIFGFFILRPYWIDYQVSKKVEVLNQYLEKTYTNEKWVIKRQEGRQYNPYHLMVEFENEKGWLYTYSVENEKTICQNAWATPDGVDTVPKEGKHYEGEHCE